MTAKQLIAEIEKLSPHKRLHVVAFAHAIVVFGSIEAASSWWHTGNSYLRGRKPEACSGERVLKLVQRIDHNLA